MPVAEDVLREWSRRHDGYDVSRSTLVRTWLRAMHLLASPLARRGVSPDVVTAAGVICAATAVVTPRRVAAALVVATAVLDGVDGAVARQRGRTTRRGAVVDHAADRSTDVLFAAALRRAGAGRRTTAAAAVSSLVFELGRDATRLLGRRPTAVVTVGERPMRVATVVLGLYVSPPAGAAALVALSVLSAMQLARRLTSHG